tara:strand:- start:1841 stop:2695 length:855 start_codon:yes stop_codon:yes gene_type:complete
MDFLEFECPLCNGLFSAAVADVEVTCPHCDEKVSLSVVDPSSPANVTMVAKQSATPEPLFPPGHKKFSATASSATPEAAPEPPPVVIMDGDTNQSVDVTASITPPATVPSELPSVVNDCNDGDGFVDDTESITPPELVADVMPAVVITDGDVDESVDDSEFITPPEPVADVIPTVVIAKDETNESLDSTVTDTAIEDLLPPGFQLDDPQTDKQTDKQETTEAAEIIDVRVDTDPATVGRGVNKRELRSRTPDEKSQFMRKKNLIVWGIGALVIIVTMIVMLQLA